MCAQTAKDPREGRTLDDLKAEAHERIRQWHADELAAVLGGNDLWASECAARALVWLETLSALNAGIVAPPRAGRRSAHV